MKVYLLTYLDILSLRHQPLNRGVRKTDHGHYEPKRYHDTIRYDTILNYRKSLTCAEQLTDSQLNLPHGTKKNGKEGKELKNRFAQKIRCG